MSFIYKHDFLYTLVGLFNELKLAIFYTFAGVGKYKTFQNNIHCMINSITHLLYITL